MAMENPPGIDDLPPKKKTMGDFLATNVWYKTEGLVGQESLHLPPIANASA